MAARILVINDTQEILELFRMLLEEEGYEVVLAGFPIQQISDIEQIKPDLIILDFVFGDQKTGWQMLQMLKMKRSWKPSDKKCNHNISIFPPSAKKSKRRNSKYKDLPSLTHFVGQA